MDADSGGILAAVCRADEAFNRGDIEGFLAVYEDDARVMVEPGIVVVGKAALRRAMSRVLGNGVRVTQLSQRLLVGDGLALWLSRWRLDRRTPGGPVAQVSYGASIFRRSAEGLWLVALEDPWLVDTLSTLFHARPAAAAAS